MPAEFKSPAEEWDFDNLDYRIIRMAVRFALPEGCQGCVAAKAATHNLAEWAVRDGKSARECVQELNSAFNNPRCEGQKEVEDNRDGCLPSFECGHSLGKAAVSGLWKGTA